MGMIQKQGNWMSYELKPRDVERRLFACEQLLERQRRKEFLHRIVTGDEKWIHYDNPKQKIIVPGFHVDGQTEYSRLQGHALYLVRPARRNVLWTVKTDWNNHRRSVSNAIDAFEPSIERQTAAIQRDTIKWFWQCSTPCCESGQDILGNVEMGSPTLPAVFSRRCFLWLSLVSINGTRPGWPALTVLWRSKKLDRFVDSLKRWPVFSYATRKMGESSGQRWTIL